MGTAGVIRILLLADIIAMALLAVVYLRQRRMNWSSYCYWGLLAIALPVLGPFIVIANRPGKWDPNFSISADIDHLVEWSAPASWPDSPKETGHAGTRPAAQAAPKSE